MLLRRKAYAAMLAWKNHSQGSTALLLTGARRVGKSYLCRQFAKAEYKSSIFIDFANVSSDVKTSIEHDSHDLDLFFTKLSSIYRTKLYPRETLLVFDEVQLFPRARQLIKYLVADGRYDYIETGSLLSIKQNVKDILIPSEEESLEVYPLDFEEFLWSLGDETTFEFLKMCYEKKMPLGQALHRKIMTDFRIYMLVGGMPQTVLEYGKGKDFAATDGVKRSILTLYRNDISKFAGNYQNKVNAIFDSLPAQLSKKEKKYKLSAIDADARMRDYEDSFMWLSDGMIVNPCFNATEPSAGLALSGDHSTHKVYMGDTGLLVTQAFWNASYSDNELYKSILLDNLRVNEGMLMENIVAQALRANGHRLYFYSRNDAVNRENNIEIDFLVSKKMKICPIEVKSSAYTTHSSLDKFRRKFSKHLGDAYILYTKDVMVKNDITCLPLYMASFL